MPVIWKNGEAINISDEEANLPPLTTPADLDARAEKAADKVLSRNKETAALALVVADIVERAFNISKAQARQRVRDLYIQYYRNL